jgi:hypothetical protein
MQPSQPLSKHGIARFYSFTTEYRSVLEDIPGVLNVAWFSDGAHFHLVGYINKQNVGFGASENPRLTVANLLYPEKVRDWRLLSSV